MHHPTVNTELALDTAEVPVTETVWPDYGPDMHGYIRLASIILTTVLVALTFTVGFLIGALTAAAIHGAHP